MGIYNRTELLAAGIAQMGQTTNEAMSSRLEIQFQAWLDRQYASWSWPFLKRRAVGINLLTGATTVTVGWDAGEVIHNQISKILSPIGFYTSNKNTKGKAEIIQSLNASLIHDETLQDSTKYRGLPQAFKVKMTSTWGVWEIIPLPFPDRDLLLSIDYYEIPAELEAGDFPIYPADRTMISTIAALALVEQKGIASPEAQTAIGEMDAMIARDRVTYSSVPGENDVLQLDSGVFR